MATFAERLKSLRREKGWSQQRLADELDLSKSSVNMYERGEREPGFETMEAIADLFNVDMNYLYGRTDIKIADPIVLAPKKPTIPPGFQPMPEMDKGDSMEPRIHDGDLVAIRSQPEVENGEIAAVRIGEEATLKHVYLHENFIELRPENPAFSSIILSREDMNAVVIEGKAVGLCRDI